MVVVLSLCSVFPTVPASFSSLSRFLCVTVGRHWSCSLSHLVASSPSLSLLSSPLLQCRFSVLYSLGSFILSGFLLYSLFFCLLFCVFILIFSSFTLGSLSASSFLFFSFQFHSLMPFLFPDLLLLVFPQLSVFSDVVAFSSCLCFSFLPPRLSSRLCPSFSYTVTLPYSFTFALLFSAWTLPMRDGFSSGEEQGMVSYIVHYSMLFFFLLLHYFV